MSRGLFVGDTDYSHQSLKDIIVDLKDWIKSITISNESLKNTLKKLENSSQWEKASQDFKIIVEKSLVMLETSKKELQNIVSDLKKEIREDHVVRLESLAKTGREMSNSFGEIWHNRFGDKKYGTKDFLIIESLYAEGRDALNNLIDLSGLSVRLKNFVGKKSGKSWYEKTVWKVMIWIVATIATAVIASIVPHYI